MVFKVKDYLGAWIYLSETVWYEKILDAVFGHPEVEPYLNEISKTISNPHYVFKSVRDSRSKLFLAKLARGTFKDYFLLIVVKYVNEAGRPVGYVSTAFITDKPPKKGKRLV